MEEAKTKKRQSRKWKMVTLFLVGISFILLIAHPVLNKIIQNKVKEKLEQLSPVTKVNFSSIRADLFASSLFIDDLSIKFKPDSTDTLHQHLFNFPRAEFTGLNFLKVLFNKKLVINKLKLEKGEIKFDQILLEKNDSLHNDLLTHMPFDDVSIGHLEIAETNVWLHSNKETKLLLKGMITIDDIEASLREASSKNNFHFSAIQCNLKDINYSTSDSNQTLQIKNLALDSRQQILRIDSFQIIPQTTKHQTNPVAASFSSITMSKVDVIKLYNNKFVAGTIVIDNSHADISNDKSISKSEIEQLPFILKQVPQEVKIDSLIINHSSIKLENVPVQDLQTGKKYFDSINLKTFSVNHFVILETNIKLHSENQFKIEKMEINNLNKSVKSDFNYSSIDGMVSNIDYSIPDAYRGIHIRKLMIDSKKELLHVDSLNIATRYSKFEFGAKLGRQADYIQATIPSIEILKLDYGQLLYKKFVADKVIVANGKIYFFRDRRLPRQLKEQPMPNGYLKKIPMEVRVNSLKVNNVSIVSEEFPKIGTQSGFLKIEKMNISMSPVFNHPNKNDPHYSDTYVDGLIMNAGLIKASIRAPLRENIYFVKGTITNLDLPKLNPSAENLGRFHIESGILNYLGFHFTATKEKANGKIVGEYHDLLIDRLKEKNGEKQVAKVPTFFLKHFIIPKNKDKSMDIARRTGKINYPRDSTRIVTFYLLKALLSGIRSSFAMGVLLPD